MTTTKPPSEEEERYNTLLLLVYKYQPKRGSELQHIVERAGLTLISAVEKPRKAKKARR